VKSFPLLAILCSLCLAWGAPAFSTTVVCTTTIIGDIVAQIAGESVDVQVLFSPDTDPHAFEPRPQDLVVLQRADLIFINGLDLETGLTDILESLGTVVISLSQNLPGLISEASEGSHLNHGLVDPHVWFDPTLVSLWVDIIAERLSTLDPPAEADIHERAAAYQTELASLDEWIITELEQIPPEYRRLVTDHHVFGYLEARYGLEQVGTVFPGLSTLSEPSARDIAALVSTIESLDIPSIFVGTTVNSSLAQQIAADTKTRVIPLYTGALSEPDGPAATYLAFMRYTVTSLVEGLAHTP
jgi:ABC-type Zn uptake system ZnuABC Zn-binding protein ZnuA